MFCRVDVGPLLLGGLLEFTTCLGGIHYEVSYLDLYTSILRTTAATAGLAGAAATATATDGRRIARVERARAVGARRRDIGSRTKVIVRRRVTARLLVVRLLRQLEDLTKLHPLVRLHRLLNVGEPSRHFV